MITNNDRNNIKIIALRVRKELENKYGSFLYGKCIEASDILVRELKRVGLNATTHQGYCLFEIYDNCTEQPYEDHVYTLVRDSNETIYIDVTLDQFKSQFDKEIPKIVILNYIPNFILRRRPGQKTLMECGWTDYYNGYREINMFDYWSKGRLQP